MWIIVVFVLQVRIKSNGCLLVQSLLNDVFNIRECTATDKQDISGIYCSQRNHCILAVCSDRNLYISSLQKFQHSLLYSFSTYISLIGVFLLGDLIDLIDKDNTVFRLLHIVVCCCQKLGNNALNVIPNIACLSQRSRIRDRERHIQKLRQCLDKIGLATSCRSDHKHVGFLDSDIVHRICCNSLVVIVDRHRHNLLGMLLSDHVLIQCCFDLVRCRDLLKIQNRLSFLFFFLRFDLLMLCRVL